jgi:hypothetical protein
LFGDHFPKASRGSALENFFTTLGISGEPRRSLILLITAAVLWAGAFQVIGTGRQLFDPGGPSLSPLVGRA